MTAAQAAPQLLTDTYPVTLAIDGRDIRFQVKRLEFGEYNRFEREFVRQRRVENKRTARISPTTYNAHCRSRDDPARRSSRISSSLARRCSVRNALQRRRPTGRTFRKLDGAQEAHLIAVACSAPPAGRARWTLKLLAERLVELEVVDAISPECVRTTLKKTTSSPG